MKIKKRKQHEANRKCVCIMFLTKSSAKAEQPNTKLMKLYAQIL